VLLIRIRTVFAGTGISVPDPALAKYLYMKKSFYFYQSLSKIGHFLFIKIAGYQYLNEFIDLGVETAMKHHKFSNDEIG
jgi:hypothetical protein